MKTIDLNADLGEGFSNDKEILEYVSSANIACGMHAGSPSTMLETVRLAINKGVALGAHPGYPDRDGFGRKKIEMPYKDLKALLLYQIGALNEIIKSEGASLAHVKAHGAMYNSAAKDTEIARAIVSASKEVNPDLLIFGLPGSSLEIESASQNMKFCSEVFADRAYMDDGSLVPRSQAGAMIESKEECAERTLTMVNESYTISINGKKVSIIADTVCLHGDSDNALEFAGFLYKTLLDNNIQIRPSV